MNGISAADSALAGLRLQQPGTKNGKSSLGQEEFLALMITQLKNQDPMKPMENGEFIGQMAQFSTVAGIGEMTRSVGELSDTFRAGQALQAAGIVGRTVLSASDTGALGDGRQLAGAVEIPFGTPAASVRIYGEDGTLVRQLGLGPQAAGLTEFGWDGRTATGETAKPGNYTVKAAIVTADGETEVPTYISARVQSITLDGNGSNALLDTDSGAKVRLSDVRVIK